jgi:hypothetical protein
MGYLKHCSLGNRVDLIKSSFVVVERCTFLGCLTSETVKGLSLALEGVHDVHGSDSLAAGVLGIGHRIANDILKKDLEDTTRLFVNETTDTLDTTTTGETANGGLGDSLDVIAKDLAMTLGSSLSESLSSFTTSRHV